jgi:hypothetical protein
LTSTQENVRTREGTELRPLTTEDDIDRI